MDRFYIKLVFTLLFYSLTGYSQVQTKDIFTKKIVDVGIVEGKQKTVTVHFDFCNRTNTLLVIQKVRTSCGCTSVEYPHYALNSKECGKIKIVLKTAGIKGYFQKSVMVTFNGLSPVLLKIKGNICSI